MMARRFPLIGWVLVLGIVTSGCAGAGWNSDGEAEVSEIVGSFPAPDGYRSSAIDFKGCASTGWLDSCGGRRANVDFIYEGLNGASSPTLSELCETIEGPLGGGGVRATSNQPAVSRANASGLQTPVTMGSKSLSRPSGPRRH